MSVTLEKQFELARDSIKHEDTLTNYRTMWMLVFQGFLFSAYANGSGLGGKSGNPTESAQGTHIGLLSFVCWASFQR